MALLATAVGCGATAALLEFSSDPIYAPIAGAVLLSAWYGGVGAAALSLAVGWTAALVLFVDPRGAFEIGDAEDMTRWAVNLAVATLIVIFAGALRLGRQRATTAALEAESSLGRAGALQQLSADLAGAASSAEVSHVLAERAAALFEAEGAALALLETGDVLVVEPIGLAASVHVPGRRIPL